MLEQKENLVNILINILNFSAGGQVVMIVQTSKLTKAVKALKGSGIQRVRPIACTLATCPLKYIQRNGQVMNGSQGTVTCAAHDGYR